MPARVALEGRALGWSLNDLRLARFDASDLRDTQIAIRERDALGDTKTGRVALLALEARVRRAALKEVGERFLEVG